MSSRFLLTLSTLVALSACERAGNDASTEGASADDASAGDTVVEDLPPSPAGAGESITSRGPAIGRRLIQEELQNSIEVVFGVDLDVEALGLPRDERIPGAFRNSAPELLLSPSRVRAYDAISEAIVEQMDFSAFLSEHALCTDSSEECRTGYIASAGLLVHRAPLPATEVDLYLPLFELAAEQGEEFEAGAKLVLRAMIQSPRFLYRMELQTPSGDRNTREINPFELSTRLSFLVWSSAPDAELLALAEEGSLPSQITVQVNRMLGHSRAQRALRQYIEQWLYLDAIPNSFGLGADMKEETYRLFERLVWEEDANLMTAFTTTRSELSGDLAGHYGLPPRGDGFETYDVTEASRLGFLTHASVMTARTINPGSSMIDRGLFVLNDLFCTEVPEPDGEALRTAIEEGAVPETSGLSQRERFAKQSEDPLCAGCHSNFDPLGLAFEVFGSAGELRSEDEFGNPLTGAGSVTLGDIDADYASAAEFTELLAQSETVARCLVEKHVQFAFGRRLGSLDSSLLEEIYDDFVAAEGSYRKLLLTIATHPDFALVEVTE